MAYPLPIEQLERLRSGCRQLAQQAAANEDDLQFLLNDARADLLEAQSILAMTIASLGSIGPVPDAIRGHVARRAEGIEAATMRCLRARQHHLAADRLMRELAGTDVPQRIEHPRSAVLVVDDHHDSRESLAMVLTGAGFLVRTAANGLEAVLAAYEIQPTVIVMDLMMPVLDGIEATRLIKAIDALRDACVIAYTATPPAAETRTASLFTAVLPKPTAPDVMVATVQRYAIRAA